MKQQSAAEAKECSLGLLVIESRRPQIGGASAAQLLLQAVSTGHSDELGQQACAGSVLKELDRSIRLENIPTIITKGIKRQRQ
jgi:hypothetical protein